MDHDRQDVSTPATRCAADIVPVAVSLSNAPPTATPSAVMGLKDLWQHRSHYVANTRWWPPFCLVVDWVAAAILIVLIAAGVDFHH